MKKSLFIYFSLFLLFIASPNFAQESRIHYEVETQAIGTTSGVVPFWMRSNQYGSIPLSGVSSAFLGRAYKNYDTTIDGYLGKPKTFDWGAGFEGRVNAGKKTELILTEAYLKAHLGPFELKAGRAKETMGLTGDTLLTSGSFAISGNALGIPKVQISIPEYYTLPLFNGLFAFKGNFAHGWVGSQTLTTASYTKLPEADTYFHQKSFYGRLGKPNWKLKLYGGFNHQVFWGNERKSQGDIYPLSNAETYLYVITGKPYGNNIIPRSKIGNHLGSIDLGFEYDFKNIRLMAYRQNLFDVGALYYLANIRDGLNGISLLNKRPVQSAIRWEKVLLEFFYSKNQAGEIWSKPTPSGDEDYYNNYFYKQGWSYKTSGLGTPLISTKSSVRNGFASDPFDYFINNRVIAFHLGFSASVQNWHYETKLSYSKNYGTFATSATGKSTGSKHDIPAQGIFNPVNQFSGYFKGSRILKRGFQFTYLAAIDRGQLLNQSEGLILGLLKKF